LAAFSVVCRIDQLDHEDLVIPQHQCPIRRI
jgi:hypothetical protein